jgi:PAS domain S-box-containing protein
MRAAKSTLNPDAPEHGACNGCPKRRANVENLFEELKRYVRFDHADEAALRAWASHAEPHFRSITDTFYEHIDAHPPARAVFSGPDQVERLKLALCEWLGQLLRGPWDDAYYARRMRIGARHVAIGLPQRYMFGAMNVVRDSLQRLAADEPAGVLARALDKMLDIELAIMLESYNEAHVEQIQRSERVERDALQQALTLSEARYDEIVERADALITTLDAAGRILLCNAKCEQLTGSPRASMQGKSWLQSFVREADRAAVQALQQSAISQHTPRLYEGPLDTPRGEHLVRWHFTTLPQGSALCAIGIDVTHEHDRAVRTRRAERMASLGTMAAGFAHEIRNPLNSAKLQLSVARRRMHDDPASRGAADRALELAETEMKRLAMLVDDFLAFARPQALRLVSVELRGLVAGVMAQLRPDAGAAGVTLHLQPGVALYVELDVELFKQLVANLVGNAIDASPAGGSVRVAVERDGSSARLSVEDEGAGFAVNAPIFEPFYTTKDHGTGLGLAIAHRIVMDHAGNVEATSRPGRTVFTITLPVGRSTQV